MTVAQNDDKVLDDLIANLEGRPARTTRAVGWSLSLATVAVIVLVSLFTLAQISALGRNAAEEALRAHRRERQFASALDSLRLSQALLDEQRLSSVLFGPPAPCVHPRGDVGCVVDQVLVGLTPLSFEQSRRLADAVNTPSDDPKWDALERAAANLAALERSVVPTAGSAEDIVQHSLYREAKAEVPRSPSRDWRLLDARLLAVALTANSGPSDRTLCTSLLARSVEPGDSPEVGSWQAECLRKSGASVEALERFRAVEEALDAAVGGDPSRPMCGRIRDGARTLAATAARVYNGLSMTLVSTSGDLGEASEAIEDAICLRRKAMQTPSQVAASEENRAVIAFQQGVRGARAVADLDVAHLAEARCWAERAIAANPQLPWSWTILHVLKSARGLDLPSLPPDSACGRVDPRPSRAEVARRLTFFDLEEFDPDELGKLLPLGWYAIEGGAGDDRVEVVLRAAGVRTQAEREAEPEDGQWTRERWLSLLQSGIRLLVAQVTGADPG